MGEGKRRGKEDGEKNSLCLLSLSPSPPSFPLLTSYLTKHEIPTKKPTCYAGYESDNILSNLLSKYPVYVLNLTEVVCNTSTPLVSASIEAGKPKHREARSSGLRQYCWTAREFISL